VKPAARRFRKRVEDEVVLSNMTSDTGPVLLPIGQDTQPSQPLPPVPIEPTPADTGRIARATAIIAFGSFSSRVLGLIRETVKADLFGATGLVSALEAATVIPTSVYNMLIGGVISSALVPVFSEYTPDGRRDDLWYLVSSLMTLATVVLTVLVILTELTVTWVVRLPSGGLGAESLQVGARLLRISMPAVIFMTLSGVLTGLLFSLKRFTLPAFSAVAVNACIVVTALLFGQRWGVTSMAVGLLVGSVAQVLLLLPGLRDANLRPVFSLRHPGLRQIGKLYIPLIFSLVISETAAILSFNLASRTGEESVAWMRYAAQLIQLPLGLVATAVSFAILPTLSQHAQRNQEPPAKASTSQIQPNEPFLATLAQGIKLVLILVIPATVGMFVLAEPVVGLVFEHGDFDAYDTLHTYTALRFALLGLIFAAVDWPLNFAFYAQQDTLTPAMVGLFAVGIYVVVALVPTLFSPLTLNGLILASSIQWASHALIMLGLLNRRMGGLHGHGLLRLLLKVIVASAGMGAITWLVAEALTHALLPGSLWDEIIAVGGAALIGLATYAALMVLFRADSGGLIEGLLRRRRSTSP
jgi:putative peptidoglycan lipid II flippase